MLYPTERSWHRRHCPALTVFIAGSPFAFERPVLRSFDFTFGIRLILELVTPFIVLLTVSPR
ncbi:MAG: hypothetical protein J0H78_10595 [Rhizobiales bacterium]|nr:hypothetical protein [Hyphomicrobiales bacterium]